MPPPARLLYICHDGDLYGSQQSLSLILKHLPAARYACFVSIARPGPLNEFLTALPNVTVLSHRRLQWVKHDRRSWLKRVGDILTLLVAAPLRVARLVRHIRQHRIALVHTNSVVSLEGALAAWIAGVPHVWHIRELFMKENPKLHMVLGRKLSRAIIRALSVRVMCISGAVQAQFEPDGKDDPKYPVIYNALDALNAPDPKTPSTDLPFRIGYVGRLSAGKRFHDLLEAVALLKQRGLAVELAVAGNFVDAAYEREITRRVQESGLSGNVNMLGYVSDVKALYQSLDVLVLPSLNEPFGRVIIESMAQGTSCVAADSGGVPEIVTHGVTGWLYPPKDAPALARQLEDLIRNPAQMSPVCEQARQMVAERFTIESQVRKLDTCYQSVLPNPVP